MDISLLIILVSSAAESLVDTCNGQSCGLPWQCVRILCVHNADSAKLGKESTNLLSTFFHTVNAFNRVWDVLPDNIRDLYRDANGSRKGVGDVVRHPQLADTLEAIAAGGADAFYMDGRIAQSIVNTVNASGGIITLEDLQTYTVKMEQPVQTEYNGKSSS